VFWMVGEKMAFSASPTAASAATRPHRGVIGCLVQVSNPQGARPAPRQMGRPPARALYAARQVLFIRIVTTAPSIGQEYSIDPPNWPSMLRLTSLLP